MEKHQTFGRRRWPLHFALAWVLTRDCTFAECAQSCDFHPRLDRDIWTSQDEVDCAWRILHPFLADARVPAFRVSAPCAIGHAGDAGEERIAPETLASLDWNDLTSDERGAVVVSSSAMISSFPPGSDPVAFTSDHIGPPVRPDGPGFMTLSDAVYWIATEGGTKRIVARDVSVWRAAFAEILPRVQSGKVRVVGRRLGASLPEACDPTAFVGLPVDYPYTDTPLSMMLGERPHIRCYGTVMPETSDPDQRSDELWGSNRRVPEWSHLQVDRADVWKFWKFTKAKKVVQRRVKTESQAIAVLADALTKDKDITRGEAKKLIGNEIGPRAFQNRVWPEARKCAGLPPLAESGAKKKNRGS